MDDSDPDLKTPDVYAISLANESYDWYRAAAKRSRRFYKISEVMLLLVSAAIPMSVVLLPTGQLLPAGLGSLVVVISGARSIFHWQENYLRFSGAREAVEAERRLYYTSSRPYDDVSTRDQRLAAAVTRIEQGEMKGWIKAVADRTKS